MPNKKEGWIEKEEEELTEEELKEHKNYLNAAYAGLSYLENFVGWVQHNEKEWAEEFRDEVDSLGNCIGNKMEMLTIEDRVLITKILITIKVLEDAFGGAVFNYFIEEQNVVRHLLEDADEDERSAAMLEPVIEDSIRDLSEKSKFDEFVDGESEEEPPKGYLLNRNPDSDFVKKIMKKSKFVVKRSVKHTTSLLRRMADHKGIPLGDLIEEMMEVYEKNHKIKKEKKK